MIDAFALVSARGTMSRIMGETEVVVVGGGVIGLGCAWRLAQRGMSVALIERGMPGCGASGASLGVLMPAPADRLGPTHSVQRASVNAYPQFVAELQAASGMDVGYERCGHLELFASPKHRDRAAHWISRANDWPTVKGQPPVESLDAKQIAKTDSLAGSAPFGGLLCRATARVCVNRLIAALTEACRRAGVAIMAGSTVDGIDIKGDRVCGVVCDGERFACNQVLVAAGAWSSRLSPLLERCAPVKPVRGEAMRLYLEGAAANGPIIKRESTYIIRAGDGELIVGATTDDTTATNARDSAHDRARVSAAGISKLTANALALAPMLADATVVSTWAGLRPKSLTGRSIMGFVPGVSGLAVATGHYKIGVCMTPVAAETMADLMTGKSPAIDLSPFAPLAS